MILHGDSLHILKTLDANSVDSIVTDPPYGLSFMGKKWDYSVPKKELWIEALRVLKPGGHLLSFGGTRTYHRMVVEIEDAGFEIRDQIQWIYASGFPKSHNIKKGDFKGWGTALKPANEPIVLARKPISEKTVAKNVLRWGTGAINIDESRIESSGDHKRPFQPTNNDRDIYGKQAGFQPTNAEGRWPANILFDESAAEQLDLQVGDNASRFFYKVPCAIANIVKTHSVQLKKLDDSVARLAAILERQEAELWLNTLLLSIQETLTELKSSEEKTTQQIQNFVAKLKHELRLIEKLSNNHASTAETLKQTDIITIIQSLLKSDFFAENVTSLTTSTRLEHGERACANRFAYIAKASKSERNKGLEGMPKKQKAQLAGAAKEGPLDPVSARYLSEPMANVHPTVKPVKLMQYLIKLITPPAGVVLDPFAGSGSTLVAAKSLNFKFIGIELNEEYVEIAEKRVANL